VTLILALAVTELLPGANLGAGCLSFNSTLCNSLASASPASKK